VERLKTEIAWLLDLVLNHKLSPDAKKLCLERIGEVESSLVAKPSYQTTGYMAPVRGTAQAPSTQALLDAQAAIIGAPIPTTPAEPIIASPQAAQAVAERQAAIKQALSGNVEKGRTSPRKF
jgi:hypothetical protein